MTVCTANVVTTVGLPTIASLARDADSGKRTDLPYETLVGDY
jgi:hypothetical protein